MSDFNYVPVQEDKPVVHPIDATKVRSLEEMGILVNAMGLAMTEEYAAEKGLSHLLIIQNELKLPKLELK